MSDTYVNFLRHKDTGEPRSIQLAGYGNYTLYAAKSTWELWRRRERIRFPRVWSSLLKVKMAEEGIPKTKLECLLAYETCDGEAYVYQFPSQLCSRHSQGRMIHNYIQTMISQSSLQ